MYHKYNVNTKIYNHLPDKKKEFPEYGRGQTLYPIFRDHQN